MRDGGGKMRTFLYRNARNVSAGKWEKGCVELRSNRCIVKLAGKVQITRDAYLLGSGCV